MKTLCQTSRELALRIKSGTDAVLALVYPEVCQVCLSRRAGPLEGYVCSTCAGDVRWIQPPFCDCCGKPVGGDVTTRFVCADCREASPGFSRARSVAIARGTLLEVIHRYKYNGSVWHESFLADLLKKRAAPELRPLEWDCIVPVPLWPARERERGFNQAERLARHLSRETAIPLNSSLVRRVRPTPTQTHLGREERHKNVAGAFAVLRNASLSAKRVVLVDDVLTTGATTGACARALVRAGAAEVCVWTVARGI